MKLTNTKLFLLAMLIGIVLTVIYFWVTEAARHPKIVRQVDSTGIYVTDQIRASDFPQLRRTRIATIIDMRPDGEARDQISSQAVETLAHQNGMTFSYIPVPHGAVPASAVEKLSVALKETKRPILLYCRTGNRAIRTYCLAEASRKEGQNEEALVSLAKDFGFTVDDLRAEIHQRIATRRTK